MKIRVPKILLCYDNTVYDTTSQTVSSGTLYVDSVKWKIRSINLLMYLEAITKIYYTTNGKSPIVGSTIDDDAVLSEHAIEYTGTFDLKNSKVKNRIIAVAKYDKPN